MSKIVLVEDDPTIQYLYKAKLELSGFKVSSAENGVKGLEIVETLSPVLVLLDIRMPVMNGDEMLAKMRATDWGSKPRVIVLTNISRDEAPSMLKFLNVDRYLVKAHYTPTQVVEVVNEVLYGTSKR